MHGLVLGVLSACVVGVARAASFTVVVNGTASHSIPESLCEPTYPVGRFELTCIFSVGLMFEVGS